MKKSVALLLCGAMALSMVAGCGSSETADTSANAEVKEEAAESKAPAEDAAEEAAAEKSYDEHIDFTYTGFYSLYQAANGHDIEADPYIQWVEDKFNVTIDQWACESANAKEEVRLWVNGGTMPDSMIWPSLPVAELREYADQELIQPLPEGWEEKWPNIATMVEKSGYSELVKVDGLTYAIPHATFGNFNQMEKLVSHSSIYFRKDWAEQVGMADLGDDSTITLAELEEYLTKVGEAGLCDNPVLGADVGAATKVFQLANGVNLEDFIATDDGYIWEPQQENYVAYVENMQDWYSRGLLDADFYVKDGATTQTEFQEGFTAALAYSGGVGNYQTLMDNLMDVAGENKLDEELRAKYQDQFAIVTLVGNDGNIYIDGIYNYWMMNTFSPECDEATMERILDMVDWFCTPEGQASERCGIPGTDFTMDENNVVTILNEDIISGEYQVSPSRFFNVWGYCGDDLAYAEGIPGRHTVERQRVLTNYAVRSKGIVFEKDDKVEALATEAKKNYSCDINAAVAEIVSGKKDAATEIAAFIENNKGLWQPVVDDLNAAE
ncbi:MAG: hypothetical protein IJ390_12215 [Lachnospiraceae bacterium]|nr:hypothetical protein [Lachnospiraceae bacterium]